MTPHTSVTLILTAAEFRLVSKALRGELRGDEARDALALQESMMRLRHAYAVELVKETARTMDNIAKRRKAAGEPSDPVDGVESTPGG